MQLSFKTMTKEEYKEKLIDKVQDNHFILNAIQCANPSTEFKIKLADLILKMLDDQNNLLPDGSIIEPIAEKIANQIPILYLSISKS